MASYFPTKDEAFAAYNAYRTLSYKGLRIAPRDTVVRELDEERRKKAAAETTKIRVWKCAYDENAYCNKETGEDKRYTWSYELVDNPNKIDPANIKAPEFVLTKKLSNIVVTKPVVTNKY